MAYKQKAGRKYSGKYMDNGVGLCSTPTNPMPKANQVAPMCGPGSNPDMQKANRLLQQAHKEKDSLRGKSGM